MSSHAVEPLDPYTWFSRLFKLLGDAQAIDLADQESLIRQAYHLVKLAPGPFRHGLPVDLDEARVERMLECNAFESAVMSLVGVKTSFTVQRDAGANEVAVVMTVDPQSVPGHGRHESGAIAMVQAWIRCLANTAGIHLPENPKSPDHRKFRPGSPPNSTEH